MLSLSRHASHNPRWYMGLATLLSLIMVALVALPSLWPGSYPWLNSLRIDTDPENMLDESEPVRVFHNRMKQEFGLYDIIVVGVVNESHPQGVFNVDTLGNIYELTQYAKTLSWEEDGQQSGVVSIDLIAPSTVDNIEQAGAGSVRFEWLMQSPPTTEAEALSISEKAQRIPFLDGTLVSSSGKALAIYVPITAKDLSYQIASQLKEKINGFNGDDEYYITGLPIAQDQFGVEMFKQMAISAPMAMLLIFVLLWLFFRNLRFIVSPLIVAVISVILTMGLLIATGNTVHIMSSMIPIFIMPIAVLDAVHILSDFFDRYPHKRDRYQTITEVMQELSSPMLYTSLTTAVGFSSLAFAPIPPVQIFGLFIGIGVLLAWFLTITLVPAYIMLMPESSLSNFGMTVDGHKSGENTLLVRLLHGTGNFTYRHARVVIAGVLVLCGIAWYGVNQIQINDNPVKWFNENHEIRVADRVMNERFAGTYMAYLTLSAETTQFSLDDYRQEIAGSLAALEQEVQDELLMALDELPTDVTTRTTVLTYLQDIVRQQQDSAMEDAEWYAWDDALILLQNAEQSDEVFKDPAVLRYIGKLQQHLVDTGLVGKSNALPDIVKTVYRELLDGDASAFRIPDSRAAVAQTLITYEGSHRPQDLWHFVTPDYRRTNLWIQLKSGDNIDMNRVVESVDRFIADNPPPVALQHDWFGLTYINVIWQEKMVAGMLDAFLGSFIIVLAMMTFLFRSFWWGLLCMMPLTVTIALIYGIIGLIGKDYDMPVAVLSSLSLGLAVDYAIHFLARSRHLRKQYDSWYDTVSAVFGEPARAIARNIIIIGCGFLPLLVAPLVPYNTVGFFISSILLFAGATSLLLLPALITLFENSLFKKTETPNA